MSTWRTTSVTLPGWIDDADLPADLDDLVGFEYYSQDVSLDIESGGSVELQRVDQDGNWETFETATDTASQVMVANRPAIRFKPVSSANFRIRWNQ